MAIPPLIENLFSLLKGIFTGTVGLTFLAILTLFITKIVWDFIFDLFLKNVKKYLDILFLPGSFLHKLWHSLVIKMLGYKVKVNFHMSFTLGDVSSQSISGEIKNTFHAFLIGIAPILNFGFVAVLIHFHPDFTAFFELVNFQPYGEILIIYLIVCFVYFGLPDWGDLTLPFTTATAKHSEIIFLLIAGFICFIIAMSIWGWLIPLINYILYCIVLIYLAEKKAFEQKVSPIEQGFEGKDNT
ncbi:MAG: hypothetical protein ACTSUR_02535 [Candidatus Heimdallarchaeaceae archaeon]